MVRGRDGTRGGAGARVDGTGIALGQEVVMTTMAGELFLNLLEQDQIWVTRDGRRLALEEMEWSHRRNVLVMLERQHKELYQEWLKEFLDEGVTVEELARLGWVAWDPVTARYRPAGARTWFERQPLVLRLRVTLAPPGCPSA